ncbi:MAG TPA: BNR-4 repeat-containing protein, partial [Sphingobacteriaceae bacterium]
MRQILAIILLFCILFNVQAQSPGKANNKIPGGEAFQSLAFDGSWNRFSSPKAIYYDGKFKRTYAGWVDNHGDILIGYYDHDNVKTQTHLLIDRLQKDDRFNPAMVMDQSGKLRVFISTQSGDIQLYSAKLAEDITSWEAPVTIAAGKTWQDHPDLHPVYLSEENKLYLFWLDEGGIPTYSSSDSDGRNWTAERKIPVASDISSNASINVKSNRINLIHLAFSSGAGVNYLSYQGGYFYTVNKQRLGSNSLPDNQGMISMAHTGTDNQ